MGFFQNLFRTISTSKDVDIDTSVAVEVSGVIIGFLRLQLMILDSKNLPDKARDNWSIGYVAGVTDALLYSKDIDNNSAVGFAVLSLVFTDIFNDTDGTMFASLMSLMSDNEIKDSMKIGGDEAMEFLKSNSNVPHKWMLHISE
jgi:hypothetical protein